MLGEYDLAIDGIGAGGHRGVQEALEQLGIQQAQFLREPIARGKRLQKMEKL